MPALAFLALYPDESVLGIGGPLTGDGGRPSPSFIGRDAKGANDG